MIAAIAPVVFPLVVAAAAGPSAGSHPFPEYERAEAEVARLRALLDEKNRSVIAERGSNDSPEALDVLEPIRRDLHMAEQRRDYLLVADGRSPQFEQAAAEVPRLREAYQRRQAEVLARYGRTDLPEAQAILSPAMKELNEAAQRLYRLQQGDLSDPAPIFRRLGIQTTFMGRPEDESVRRYVDSRVSDGTLSSTQAEKLLFIISKRTGRIMNPESKGAVAYAYAVTQTLARFGIDKPKSRWPALFAASAKIIHPPIGRICLGPTIQGIPVGAVIPAPVPALKLHSQVALQVFAKGCHSTSEHFVELPKIYESGPGRWTVSGGFTAEVPDGPILPDCGSGAVGRPIGWLSAGPWEITAGPLRLTIDVPADGSPLPAGPGMQGMPDGWLCAGEP